MLFFLVVNVTFPFSGCLSGLCFGLSLLLSPIVMTFCRKKSTRLTGVIGGLVLALGVLFTSFANQFYQLFFSYGTVICKYHNFLWNLYSFILGDPNKILLIQIAISLKKTSIFDQMMVKPKCVWKAYVFKVYF